MDLQTLYNNLDDLVLAWLIHIVAVFTSEFLRKWILEGGLSRLGLDFHEMRVGVVEMIGTMECAVVCFELNFIIYDVFGPGVYTICTFLSLMWQAQREKEFYYFANPSILAAKHVKAMRGSANSFGSYTYLLALLLGECAGAYLAYEFLMCFAWKYAYLWTFWKSSNYHMTRFSSAWKTSLTTSLNNGMLIEGGFSFLSYMWPKIIRDQFNFNGGAADILVEGGRAIMSGVGAQYTGGFYNPIMASALEYSTGGWSVNQKLQVYWFAPILGALIASFLY